MDTNAKNELSKKDQIIRNLKASNCQQTSNNASVIKRDILDEGFQKTSKKVIKVMKEDLDTKTRIDNIDFTGQMIARGVGFSNQPGEQMLVVIIKKMEVYKYHVFKPESFLNKTRTCFGYQLLAFKQLIDVLEEFQ